jgi:hypothetical protein
MMIISQKFPFGNSIPIFFFRKTEKSGGYEAEPKQTSVARETLIEG